KSFGQDFTEKCDASELSNKDNEATLCISRKEIQLGAALSSNRVSPNTALCQNIQDELQCLMTFFTSCYDDESVERGKFNFFYSQASTLFNNTKIDSQSFLQECNLLRDLQGEFMRYRTGSNKCSFVDYATKFIPQNKACYSRVDEQFSVKLAFADFLSGPSKAQFIVSSACEAYNGFTKQCLQKLVDTCFVGEKAEEWIADDFKNNHKELQDIVQRTFDPDFTFEGSCSNLVPGLESQLSLPSRLSKRSAEPFTSARSYLVSEDL
ncbi:Uncharacterized protein FKW44_011377, partial [Caligus rogercresseyi]